MITSRIKPRSGCFTGAPSNFSPGAVVYVDGENRGRVLGTHPPFPATPGGFSLIAMQGDDGEFYFAFYRPEESASLSWKAGAESLPWVKELMKS